jgi:hypothetical protein
MIKHIATIAGITIAVSFVAVFFVGRAETRRLDEVAPRVGLSHEDLIAMGPRVSSVSGATLGTSRRVVYLLACSGQASGATLESEAVRAGTLARQNRLTDREAVIAVLVGSGRRPEGLKDC